MNNLQVRKDEILKLRKYIRSDLKEKALNKLKELKLKEENQLELRDLVISLLKESDGAQMMNNTGINVLADLLKKIVPIFDQDFKLLTTSAEQRKSYRAHIIRAVVDALLPSRMELSTAEKIDQSSAPPSQVATKDLPNGEEQFGSESLSPSLGGGKVLGGQYSNDEIDINIKEQQDLSKKFIPIDKPKDNEEEKEEDSFSLPHYDTTGRNVALKSWKKVEKTTIDAYNLLSNKNDRRMFFDYLITNLKLYFDRFEADLSPIVEEPTTKEYQETVSTRNQYNSGNNIQESKNKVLKEVHLLSTRSLDNFYKKRFLAVSLASSMREFVKVGRNS